MRSKAIAAIIESWLALGSYVTAGFEYYNHHGIFGALFTIVGVFATILMIDLLHNIRS